MPMMMRGRTMVFRLWALRMKWLSIFSVISKSAITPSFMGRMATMLPGVRPSISLASLPTASTFPVTLFTATMEGSDHDPLVLRVHERVGGAEVDGQVVGQEAQVGDRTQVQGRLLLVTWA